MSHTIIGVKLNWNGCLSRSQHSLFFLAKKWDLISKNRTHILPETNIALEKMHGYWCYWKINFSSLLFGARRNLTGAIPVSFRVSVNFGFVLLEQHTNEWSWPQKFSIQHQRLRKNASAHAPKFLSRSINGRMMMSKNNFQFPTMQIIQIINIQGGTRA